MVITGLSKSDTNFLVSEVYSTVLEPMYISEVHRKLEHRGGEWLLKQVKEAIEILLGDGRVESVFVQAGQQKSHSIPSLKGETDEWKDYVVVTVADKSVVADDVMEYARSSGHNPDMVVGEKVEMIKRLSQNGLLNAQNTERVFQDLIIEIFGHETITLSDFSSSKPDVIIDDKKLILEVSNRYENPVDSTYVQTKMSAVRRGFDVIIVAPKFTDKVQQKHRDSEFVSLIELYNDYLIISPETFFSHAEVGQFQRDLDYVERSWLMVSETIFRGDVEERIMEVV